MIVLVGVLGLLCGFALASLVMAVPRRRPAWRAKDVEPRRAAHDRTAPGAVGQTGGETDYCYGRDQIGREIERKVKAMANRWYDKGKKHFAFGDVVWKAAGGSTIRAFLVDSADYTVDTVGHEFLSSVTIAGREGGTGTGYNQGALLTLIDAADGGILDAADTTFSAVSGDQAEYIVIYKQGTSDADSILLLLIDTATGLAITPSGGDIIVQWDNGANKIAKL